MIKYNNFKVARDRVAFSTIQSQRRTNRFRQRPGWAEDAHLRAYLMDLSSINLKKKNNQIASIDSLPNRNIEILFQISRSDFWYFASVSYVMSKCQKPSASSVMTTRQPSSYHRLREPGYSYSEAGIWLSYFAGSHCSGDHQSDPRVLIFKLKNLQSIITTNNYAFIPHSNFLFVIILIFNFVINLSLHFQRNFYIILWEKFHKRVYIFTFCVKLPIYK